MGIISKSWLLSDFCGLYGRVIPDGIDESGHFTAFHCADRKHDDSAIIICSEKQGAQTATMSGILSMRGYVVEFENKDEYLFCTESELESLQQLSNQEKEEQKKRKKETLHPARPVGVEITKEIQDRRFKSYEICPDYNIKKETLRSVKLPPFDDWECREWLCKDDCIFPNCPFYDMMHLDEFTHNHRDDYDTWVVEFSKDVPGEQGREDLMTDYSSQTNTDIYIDPTPELTKKARFRGLFETPLDEVIWKYLPKERREQIVNTCITPKAKTWMALLRLNFVARTKTFKRSIEDILDSKIPTSKC